MFWQPITLFTLSHSDLIIHLNVNMSILLCIGGYNTLSHSLTVLSFVQFLQKWQAIETAEKSTSSAVNVGVWMQMAPTTLATLADHINGSDRKVSASWYLFTVSNSGLLFSCGRPSQQLLSTCFSLVTLNFNLWPWFSNLTYLLSVDQSVCQLYVSKFIYFNSCCPDTHRHSGTIALPGPLKWSVRSSDHYHTNN